MNRSQKIWILSIGLIAASTLTLFQNCGQVVFQTEADSANRLGNPNPPVVCDPFNAAATGCPPGGGGPTGGLKGNLYYQDKKSTDAAWTKVDDYITKGIRTPYLIQLTSIFVPTRKFDVGFQDPNGNFVSKNPEHGGAKLVEWFAFEVDGVMKLAPGEVAGDYEFAIISDDGSIVQIKDSTGAWTNFINNDGDTSTRMGCSAKIALDPTSRIPVRVKYFQGPANEIAVNFVYRKKPSGHTGSPDANCNKADSNFYGVIDNGTSLGRTHAQLCSQFPTSLYGKLCTRGWKPLTADNFE